MQRQIKVKQCRTYSTADLRKVSMTRGQLPQLTDRSNDIEDGKRVSWENMPTSSDLKTLFDSSNFSKNSSSNSSQTQLDDQQQQNILATK